MRCSKKKCNFRGFDEGVPKATQASSVLHSIDIAASLKRHRAARFAKYHAYTVNLIISFNLINGIVLNFVCYFKYSSLCCSQSFSDEIIVGIIEERLALILKTSTYGWAFRDRLVYTWRSKRSYITTKERLRSCIILDTCDRFSVILVIEEKQMADDRCLLRCNSCSQLIHLYILMKRTNNFSCEYLQCFTRWLNDHSFRNIILPISQIPKQCKFQKQRD